MNLQKTITPIDNSIYLERELASDNKINSVIDKASTSFEIWKNTSPVSYTHLTLPTILLV